MVGDPIIAASARKHGISAEEIHHVYRNPVRIFDLDDEFTMIIGPDSRGALLEIGIVRGGDDVVIIHAMPAREKYHS